MGYNVMSYGFMLNIHRDDDVADLTSRSMETLDPDVCHVSPDNYYADRWKRRKSQKALERKYDEISREERRARARNGKRKVVLNKHGREPDEWEIPILDKNREFYTNSSYAQHLEEKEQIRLAQVRLDEVAGVKKSAAEMELKLAPAPEEDRVPSWLDPQNYTDGS